MSRILTQLLYIAIFCLSTLLAFCAQSKKVGINNKCATIIKPIPFIISFAIPWFFIAFTNIGSDYSNYAMIISRLNWQNYSSFFDEEPIMNIVFLLVRTVALNNADVTIFIIKSITIVIFYTSFYIARDKINIGYSIFAYLLLIYLPSFYLLTIALSSSLICFSFSLLIFRERKIIPFLITIFSAQLHNSAYLIIPVLLVCFFYKFFTNGDARKLLFALIYIILILFSSVIYSYFVQNVDWFHYLNYGNNDFSGSGLMAIVKIVPLFLIYFYVRKYLDNRRNNYFFILVLSSSLFIILGYRFTVIERMEFYFLPIYAFLIPSYFNARQVRTKNKEQLSISLDNALIIAYILFRGILVFIERTTSASGVGNYFFFNPFC